MKFKYLSCNLRLYIYQCVYICPNPLQFLYFIPIHCNEIEQLISSVFSFASCSLGREALTNCSVSDISFPPFADSASLYPRAPEHTKDSPLHIICLFPKDYYKMERHGSLQIYCVLKSKSIKSMSMRTPPPIYMCVSVSVSVCVWCVCVCVCVCVCK